VTDRQPIKIAPSYLNPKSAPTAILVFGESGGAEEGREGRAFVGRAGRYLRMILRGAFPRMRMVLDNVVPLYLWGKKPTPKQIHEYEGYRDHRIDQEDPLVVLLLGEHAQSAYGIKRTPTRTNGEIMFVEGRPFVLGVHPAYIIRNRKLSPLYYDVLRALRTSFRRPREKFRRVDKLPDLKKELRAIATKTVAFDLETSTLDPRDGNILTAAFCSGPRKVFWVPLFHEESWNRSTKPLLREILNWWVKGPRICHNVKFELKWMRTWRKALGLDPTVDPPKLYDTLLQGVAIDENQPRRLDYHVVQNLGKPPYWQEIPKGVGLADVPLRIVGIYNANDALHTYLLHAKQSLSLSSAEVRTLEGIFLPCSQALSSMEMSGVKVNFDELRKGEKEIANRRAALGKKVQAKHPGLNVRSSAEVGERLFKQLKLGPTVLTKTGKVSTSEEILTALSHKHKTVGDILELRKLMSATSRIFEGWAKYDRDGYLHSNFNVGGAKTWRLSSSNPNLQNIDRAQAQRRALVSRFPGGQLVQLDYSQHELRLMAAQSGTKKLLNLWKSDRKADVHQSTADQLRCPRQTAKNINFSLIYAITAWGLEQRYGIERSKGEALIKRWFETYPEVKAYHEKLEKSFEKNFWVENMFGLRRHLTDPSDQRQLRQAYNYPIQSAAVILCLLALVEMERWLRRERMESLLILQIHDSLVLDCPKGEVARVSKIGRDIMLRVPYQEYTKGRLVYDLPLEVEAKIGPYLVG